MNEIYVAGVGMTPFGKQANRSIKDLAAAALNAALDDAGARREQIEAVFYGNCVQGHMEGQDMVRGEIALREAGIERIPVVNVENACATGSTALHMAVSYVKSGACDIALAIGAEKMFSSDKALMFAAFDGAWDVHTVEKNRDLVENEYMAGQVSLVRLNEAQRDLIQQQGRLALARVALRQAWHDLRVATGEILEELGS